MLTDEIFDRIDEIVPLGTDVGTLDQAYLPPALQADCLALASEPHTAEWLFKRCGDLEGGQGSV